MKEPYVCTASDSRTYKCPHDGKPVEECKASLPYKDGSCLFYHRMSAYRKSRPETREIYGVLGAALQKAV